MGKDVAEAYVEARLVYQEADEALGFSLSRVCFEGPEETLVLTENTQPAILATSVAILRVLESRAPRPDFVAGHSLGEYSALVCAGALSLVDAVRLVRLRGRLMQEAVPVGVGAMAAILGLDLSEVERICREASQGEVVSPANINSPEQIVIAGHTAAVERAGKLATGAGAKKVLPLPVSAPFHCALMKPAQDRLALELEKTPFDDLRTPLLNNVDAAVVETAADARRGLVRQVSGAVRWSGCVSAMLTAGVRSFFEIGPGRVLSGLIRRVDRTLEVCSVGTREQVESLCLS